ncbi:MAG: FHA domain-containing protein [Marmoricola sp.]
MTRVDIAADLTVQFTGVDGQTAAGHLHGTHGRLTLDLDNPGVFAGSGDAVMVRSLASNLAGRGVQIRVQHEGVHLVSIGAVTAPWWQRRATGSKRIRVGSWRGAWTSLRSRATANEPVLPDASALPPPTLFPILPTFARYPRRKVTTTHDPSGSGSPRLVLKKQDLWEGEQQPVFWLDRAETTIGSDPGCDIVLPGLAPVHTMVRHDDDDEFVLGNLGHESRVHGAVVHSFAVLRTGARIDVGAHQLSFYREEYADHGRPHGGRIGGEAGHQRSQAARRSS